MNTAKKNKKSFNSMAIGLVTGILLPIIIMTIYYFFKFQKNYTFVQFIDLFKSANVLTHIISLCALPNLLLFFIYLWTNREISSKGVILATLIITGIVLVMKIS